MARYDGDQELADECIAAFNSSLQTPISGKFGSVLKVTVRDSQYFVKRVVSTDKNIIKTELGINLKLTREIPEFVSNLICSKYTDTGVSAEVYLVFEAPPGYNLYEYMVAMGDKWKRNADKLYCSIKAAQLAMNRAGFIHRDIKPGNIYVIVENGVFKKCKLIDMGLSVRIGTKTRPAGTLNYMPPTMRNLRSYRRTHNNKAFSAHNDYSVDYIWRYDFGMTRDPPNCSRGGRRTRRNR